MGPYKCINCGQVGASVRCGACGGDAEPEDIPVGYSIFSHAQLGHVEPCARTVRDFRPGFLDTGDDN